MTPNPFDQPPPPDIPTNTVHPDLLAWVKQTLDAEALLRELDELQATGGCTFESFIDEIEARAAGS